MKPKQTFRYVYILFLILCLPSHAFAENNQWTAIDTALAVSFLTVHSLDYTQTSYIARHPYLYHEDGLIAQKIIGRHPSSENVALYFVGMAALKVGVPAMLPTLFRRSAYVFFISDSADCVRHGLTIGLRVGF